MHPAIRVEHLSKDFGPRSRALDDVSLTVAPGEMVALIGASGSGKSTLLRHVAGLAVSNRDERARITVGGRPIQASGRLAPGIRATRSRIGFVFQQFNLVDRLPVITNVLVGALGRTKLWRSLLYRFPESDRRDAIRALTRVGIAERVFQRASTLSGGQQQRAAIARALVQRPELILADEPIASLDPESARRVMQILADINREDGITVVVSLHQVGFALRYCRRVVALANGRVVFDGPAATLDAERLHRIYGAGSDLDFTEIEPAVADRRAGAGAGTLIPATAGA